MGYALVHINLSDIDDEDIRAEAEDRNLIDIGYFSNGELLEEVKTRQLHSDPKVYKICDNILRKYQHKVDYEDEIREMIYYVLGRII